MKRVCAWCKKYMGEKPGGPGISHGICDECQEIIMAAPKGHLEVTDGDGISIPPLPVSRPFLMKRINHDR